MEIDEEPTTAQPKDIKRVSKDTVHKICSSQVILNFAVAVKELLENSIDAGAKTVEIKIKNFGSEGFEVADNGSGISKEDFDGISAKHHTSKLKEFSDLESIRTFGFRGEALSSLCALSNVTITTRHSSSEHGTKLVFDHNGVIQKKSICARNFGTTVSVTDFFTTIPVRRGEFLKNYRKDFNKMVQLIQEYCLVLTGVKIICTNQTEKGARQTVLATNGSSVMENIISIFGANQAKSLIKISSPTEDGTEEGTYTQKSLADLDSSISSDIKQPEIDMLNIARFKIQGFISNIDHSSARSSKDRQFFYVNSRPVELRIVSKLVNDIYHRYNMKQFPFVYLNLKMDRSSVDVNMSKDKRQVAICNDTVLQIAVKKSLLNTFGELPTKFKLVSVNNSVKNLQTDEDESDDDEDKIFTPDPGSSFNGTLKQWRMNPFESEPKPTKSHKRKSSNEPKDQKASKIKIHFHELIKKIEERKENESNSAKSEDLNLDDTGTETHVSSLIQPDVSFRIDCKNRNSENTLKFNFVEKKNISPQNSVESLEKTFLEMDEAPTQKIPEPSWSIFKSLSSSQLLTPSGSSQSSGPSSQLSAIRLVSEPSTPPSSNEDCDTSNQNFNICEIIEVDSQKVDNSRKSHKIKISLESIKDMAKAEEEAYDEMRKEKTTRKLKLRFKESIDPSKNKKAEAELETEIQKEMFSEMEVLGQFNLGFIIAKLKSDLFIVDQHASDEKYNFEDLQINLKLETQPLVVPEKLELSAIQEMTLIENLKTFELNGFKFLIDDDAEPGKKIKIHSKPFSKNWEFGKEDIEEMIYMLDDGSNGVCRPSRVRTMLASRACRKSVMIGDALTRKQMKKLLEHMGELEHPWNCPHGRPTLRYLQNLDFIDNIES